MFRAALHMVCSTVHSNDTLGNTSFNQTSMISDFFHLRLGASVWGDQQHSYSLKVFIVFVALGLPFPHVHLSIGGRGATGFQFM